MSNGDARIALNILEYASSLSKNIDKSIVKQAFQNQICFMIKMGKNIII